MQKLIELAAVGIGAFLLLGGRDEKASAVQACFERFHDRIRLGEENEKAELREKRELILDALQSYLPPTVPTYESFHQGSYAMHTGTIPPGGDFDIDVGLIFDCKRTQYSDPVALKVAVRDALKRNGREVTIRRSCVTAHYSSGGEPAYHVDLAIYVKRSDGFLDIAKGKEFSKAEHRFWEKSDPRGLTKVLCNRFRDDEVRQYRRCIRYMKRWRDNQFTAGAPLSIALTAAAYHWFKPHHTFGGTPLDLLALRHWTKAMLDQFKEVSTAEGKYQRLRVCLPVEPKSDLLVKMTRAQMNRFHAALTSLHKCLSDAHALPATEDCVRLLAEQFGNDFS
jgi:hypothetical protein